MKRRNLIGVLAWVVRKVGNALHQINHYPADSVVFFFVTAYPLDSVLSGGERYPPLEQPRPERSKI